MSKYSKMSLLIRGLILGLLAGLVNGLALPVLFEIYSMVINGLYAGLWQGFGVMELWVIWFVFGFAFSLLPGIVVSIALSLGMQYILSHKRYIKWLSICAEIIVGACSAICYVLLLSVFEIFISRESNVLAAILFIGQMLIYSWIAFRLSAYYQMKG